MLARAKFDDSGTFGDYFDRDGVRKAYSLTEKLGTEAFSVRHGISLIFWRG